MKKRAVSTPSEATTGVTSPDKIHHYLGEPLPGLILAWSPSTVDSDRASLQGGLTVGRSSSCRWSISDRQLSRRHFVVCRLGDKSILEDLGSSHGTYVNGVRVDKPTEVRPDMVIRGGNCLFCPVDDLDKLAPQGKSEVEGLAGQFHALPLARRLRLAAQTGKSIMLSGESGSGKELAASIVHHALSQLARTGPYVTQNAACYANEDDAVRTILGVAKGAFTGVTHKPGVLEQSAGGTLFLDEVHNLPIRVQRSLLRFLEDGLTRPLGGTSDHRLDVRLILGTNVDVDEAIDKGLLAHDLVARLHRVHIPALRERRADIPSIFIRVLQRAVADAGLADSLLESLVVTDMERLCLAKYVGTNVRELEQIAAYIAALLNEGELQAARALSAGLDEFLPPTLQSAPASTKKTSVYERHQNQIIDLFKSTDGNLTQIVDELHRQGVRINRRWLAEYLDRWGIRPKPSGGK